MAFSVLALLFLAVLSVGHAQTLPDLINYTFTVAETKTLPGTSAAPGAQCNGTIAAADQNGGLALVAAFYQNGCYTDGRYNHNNYRVDRGTVSAPGGPANLAAYKIYEPANKATQFLASKHAIYYRFPTKENYTVYALAGGALSKVTEVPATAIPNTTDLVPVSNAATPITASEVAGSVTYVFVPSATRVSSYALLATGVEGARVAATPFGNVLKYRYTVPGTPYDSAVDYSRGPGDWANTYSDTRRFFLVRNGNTLGAVWQNQVDSSLKLTWFGADRKSPTTVALANPATQGLACATGDDTGHVYYLTVQQGSGAPNTRRNATLSKAGPNGAVLATTAVDTSANGLNVVAFDGNVASLQYLNGKLAVMMGRTMLRSADGLNHQGGIAAVFNATTLALEKNWGQTSGHSWENALTTNANGEFVGINQGDNFPRGINLHKFTGTNKSSRVISTFKTKHGTTARNPAGTTYPVYTEISGGGTTYYRWSNDNRTYTELGGIAQTAQGYAVSFTAERSPDGRLLDSTRTGATLNDPRNIGFITVREDFHNATGGGTEVSDDLVRTTGLAETGGYYNFTGGWTPQRNAGVVWLTQYDTQAQNASRLKMTSRADGNLLLLWEVWTANSYGGTKGMTVAANGTIVNGETDLSNQVRLSRRGDPLRVDNSIYLVTGNKTEKTLELTVIEPGGGGAATTPRDWTARGPAKDIGVGADGSVWKIGTDPVAGGYRIEKWNGKDWDKIDGGAVRIAVDPQGNPWVVNSFGDIFQRTGSVWQHRAGQKAKDIGVGADGSVWIIGNDTAPLGGYRIYKRIGDTWNRFSGAAVRIAVAPNGIPWVVNDSGTTFRANDTQASSWTQLPGTATDIGVGADGTVWVTGTNNMDGGHEIRRWNESGWNTIAGRTAVDIAVTPSGWPWVVNSADTIFEYALVETADL